MSYMSGGKICKNYFLNFVLKLYPVCMVLNSQGRSNDIYSNTTKYRKQYHTPEKVPKSYRQIVERKTRSILL